ncbi:unnamed protein product [Jaminaea pallidilutea]
MGIKQDLIAALGEFTGTTLFLLLALGGAKTAQYTRTASQTQGLQTALGNETISFIALSFGLSLLVTAWVFYRVTGGLFNPAITLALFLIGGLSSFRAVLLCVAQILGGIAGAGLVAVLTPFGGASSVNTTLGTGVNIGQGLFIEAFLTASLVLTVLFLAAEKHRSTHLAPVGIGLVLLACHLFGVAWTGCGINPARAFGPAVISATFPGYHWIYWVGPLIGSLLAVGFYLMLKAFDYTSVVFGQDADHEVNTAERQVAGTGLFRALSSRFVVYHSKGGGDATVPASTAPYDPDNAQMVEALRAGEASLVDPSDAEKGFASADPVPVSAGAPGQMANGGRSGTATPSGNQAAAAGGQTDGGYFQPPNGYPSMKPEAQNVGGLQVPGTTSSGLAVIPVAKVILRS